jgi:hypothetical protein
VVFIRPFDLTTFSRPGKRDCFGCQSFYTPSFDPLYAAAYRLLGLQGYRSGVARPNYIGNLISWRQSNVTALRDRLEHLWGRPG